jgi:hypothetical protein
LREVVAAAGGCDFGVDIDRRQGRRRLSLVALAAGMTRTTKMIAQSGDSGRMRHRRATSIGGGDRDRGGDDEDDNDRARRWQQEDEKWTMTIIVRGAGGWDDEDDDDNRAKR